MFTGWVLLLSISLLTLLRETNGAAAAMLVKLGDTVVIDFGDNVKEVETTVLIVKDGNLTNFAQKKFGDRIKWHDGTLTIKNIKSSDFTTFLYHLHDKPMAISLVEK
ncbi:ADAMTS-like protein [Dirofilaria immitis]